MSRIGKITVSAALLIPLALGGCKPTEVTASPADYFALIQMALGMGETGARIGRNEAIKAKNFEGCVASEALVSAFDSANQALAGKLDDAMTIPAVDIDVSGCLGLREAPAESAYMIHTIHTKVAGYRVAPEEAPAPAAEEAPEEAPAPAAEEAPGEAPAVEGAPEEAPEAPEAPEAKPAEEAVPALKGNPKAAAMVEMIAGITMSAVLSYSARIKDADCKRGTAALGAIHYINGMIKPISDEIAEPDGVLSVPAVVVDLSECDED